MRRRPDFLLWVILCLSLGACACTTTTCDQQTAEVVATAYAAAWFPDQFETIVTQNRSAFASPGFAQCTDRLAGKLEEHALRELGQKETDEIAYRIAAEGGRPDLGPQVAEASKKTARDMLAIARYLRQVSASVQGILSGDNSVYRNSELYQTARLVNWALEEGRQGLGVEPGPFRQMMFKLNHQIVFQYALAAR